nr:ribonuclease H-like domain-containing protein [Tanacetum cinerariifolium]
VILNGDSLAPTRVIEGVVQPVAPTTAEQRLARKNELNARGTLLMALPDKHQLKFNIHKDAKTLMEAIEKRFGGNKETKKRTHTLIWRNKTDLKEQSLDDLFNSLKIYEAEVKSSSSSSTSTQNIAFVSSQTTDSTNDPVSAVASVSAASAKIPVSALSNVDTLSNVVIYSFFASQSNSPQLDNDDLKQIDRTGRNLRADGPTSMGFDMSKVECYNCHMKGHFARECRSPKDTKRNVAAELQRRNVPVETSRSNALVSQCDGVGSYDWSFQTEEEPTNYALMAFTSSSSFSSDNEMFSSETDDSLPTSPIYDRYHSGDGYHVVLPPYTGIFMPPKPDLVFHDAPNVTEIDQTAFNVELNPTKPNKDLSYTYRPSTPIIEEWVSNSKDDSEAEIPQNTPSFVQTTKQVKPPMSSVKTVENSIPAANHKTAIPKLQSHGKRGNRKACFVCKSLTHLIKDCDYYDKTVAQTSARNHAQRGNHEQYARMTLLNPQRHVVPTTVLTKSKLVLITAARPVTTAVLKTHVIRPRPAKSVVTNPHSPPRRHINRSQSFKPSNFSLKVTAAKAPMVNAVKGNWGNPHRVLKDKGVIDSRCSRHMIGNMSYLSDFEKLNGGYVAFSGTPNGGKISGKGKIRTGKLDFDDVYFVKELKFNLFSVSLMCDKKNSVLFTETECIVLSPEFNLPDENQVLLRVPRKNNMYNVDLKNIVPSGYLTCLFAKAILDESNLWHKRLGHINFKTMIKLNRVLVTKPQNETLYDLLLGRTPSIGFMRPFGCPVTILNTLDPLGKFDGKADEGFLVGYSVSSKAFRVFDSRTRIVQETLHINFLENKPNVVGSGPTWLFHIDTLTKTMNYQPVTAGNQSNPSAGVQEQFDAEQAGKDNVQQYVLFPVWFFGSKNPQNTDDDAAFRGKKPEFEGRKPESEVHVSPSCSAQTKKHDDKTKKEAKGKSHVELSTGYRNLSAKFKDFSDNSINEDNVADSQVHAVGQISTNSTNTFSAAGPSNTTVNITYSNDEEDVGAEADFTNLETTITVSPIPTTRVHKDHHVTQIIGDLSSATQTRSMTRVVRDQGGLTQINNEDFHTCMFACFLSQEEPKRVPNGFLGTKRMKEALQSGIKLDLLHKDTLKRRALIMKKSLLQYAFLYETIEEEVYVCQPPRFEDPDYPDKRGKIDQTLFIKRAQVDDLSSHSTKYSSPALTQKVFTNIRRVEKGFSRVDTHLFEGMIVAQQADDVADEGAADVDVDVDVVPATADEPSIPSPTLTTQPPPPSQELPSTSQVLPTPSPSPIAQPPSPQQQLQPSQPSVKKLERRNKLKVSKLKRLKRIGTAQRVDTSEDTVMDDVSKQGEIIANMDADEDVTLKDVAKEVAVEKDAEIEENADDDKLEPTELKEVVEVVTTTELMTDVVTVAAATITVVDTLITAATLTVAPSAARRREGVVI